MSVWLGQYCSSGFISELSRIDLSLALKGTAETHPGYAVAQLVEALRDKPEGRGFES